MSLSWANADSVALRALLAKVPRERIRETMRARCPAVITTETVLSSDEHGLARLASFKAGWEAYEQSLLELADKDQSSQPDPAYRDMT